MGEDCARARVTATVTPCSGRASSHAIDSWSPATSPTTVTAGARTPSAAARSAIESSVPTVVRWSAIVPRSTIATGCDGGRPPATSCDVIRGSALTPM